MSDPIPREWTFPVTIAAKAAILNQHDSSVNENEWWTGLGTQWLTCICNGLHVDEDSLPSAPTAQDTANFSSMIPTESHPELVASLLTLTLAQPAASSSTSPNTMIYTASSRAFLARTISLLGIPYSHLLDAEQEISAQLFSAVKDAEMKSKSEELRKGKEHGWGGKWGRIAATTGGVILGGLAIGLTSGLAAPVLLPLLPFLSASAAPAIIGTLFGLTGGGLAGYRVRRRWGGVEEFEFIEISNPETNKAIKTLEYTAYKPKLKKEDKKKVVPLPEKAPSLLATVLIPGIQTSSPTESLESYRQCLPLFSAYTHDVFFLQHSPKVMLTTGKALKSWITTQIVARVGKEVLQRTALNAAMAAVALPVTIYKATGMAVDNEWIQGCDKARKAGVLLAEVLRERIQGNRPIVLIGSSLGALTLFQALLTLSSGTANNDKDSKEEDLGPLVDSAIFISLPLAPSASEWKAVRGVVARRVVNAYCKADMVLAVVGRLHEVVGGANVGSMAGLAPVSKEGNGIENVDLGEVIQGHFELASNMMEVLASVGINK